MTISISNIPSSAKLGVLLSPAISFTGAVSNGTVRIRDLTSGYDSGAVAYTGTTGTVPFTPSGSAGSHAIQLIFSGDGTFNYTVPIYNTLLTTAISVDPVTIYVGQAIASPITPVTTNGGDGSATFAISPALPSGLSFNTTNGQITGTTNISTSVLYTITVTDSSSQTSSKQVTVTITFHVPVSSSTSTTVIYNSNAIEVPLSIQYQYTSVAVVTPPSHGTTSIVGTKIYYTPTPGWWTTDSFTYTATGYGGTSNISTANITIDTSNVALLPTVSAGALTRGITTIPINPIIFGATGGQAPYAFTPSGNLPTGLTFDYGAGSISGTPNTVGNFNFSITSIDSSTPNPFSVVTNYSMNVLSLDDVATIVNEEKPSKYSKTSEFWNKTPITVTPQSNWDQWGLYRSYIGSTSVGWGSDSIQNANGTVDIPYSGSNVDVVIIASGSADPNHPEFAVNSDGTGGSRIKYHNWLSKTGGVYSDKGYRSKNANAAAAITSIVAGNTYGWARNANIYTLDVSLMPSTELVTTTVSFYGGGTINISFIVDKEVLTAAFDAIADFHSSKLPNPVTGLQNPTIVVCSQTRTHQPFIASSATSVTFEGVTYNSTPFSTSTLATYFVDSPFTSMSTTTAYRYDINLYKNDTAVTAAVQRCTSLTGLVFVGAAGDYRGYIDTSDGPDYHNTLTNFTTSSIFYCQGPSPSNAGICVGAADSTAVEAIANYSARGPGVHLYAPGSDLMAAFNSEQSVPNLYYEDSIPTASDPRNDLYSIGKVSGTAYAAAQVAGFLACLAQVTPTITQSSALNYLQNNAGINQLTTGTNTVSKGTTRQLYGAQSTFQKIFDTSLTPGYGSFLNTYGVWTNADRSNPLDTEVDTTLFFTAATTGTYVLQVSADNELSVFVNNSPTASIKTINSYGGSEYVNITLHSGINTLLCKAFNYSGDGFVFRSAAFAVVVQDSYGNHIFETSANLPVSPVPLSTPVNNLYLFGKFPNIKETVVSAPAVATNQPFSITVDGGVPNSAFYIKGTDNVVGTRTLGNGTISNNFSGNFTLTNQIFTTPGIKNYEFYFANTTDRVSLSVEVIEHDKTQIISSYTQTGKLWNKTHEYIPPKNDWLNWGLLRSSTTTNTLNWGSDSVKVDTDGTISVPYAGLNVDIVIIDTGSIDPNHPEFALYSDGTGGSRVKYYNWTGSYPTIDGYNTADANKASAVASVAAGNTYGWARAAHIYSLNYKLLPAGPQAADAFNRVSQFHANKAINPVTGYKNPTIIIAGWAETVILPSTGSVKYQTDALRSGPISLSELTTRYGLVAPYSKSGNNDLYLNVRDPDLDTAVEYAVNTIGITVISVPGDNSAYCAIDSSDPNWNNFYRPAGTVDSYYYHRGASPGAVPGVICVGALDSEVKQHKAPYSGNGPRVDLFAPGSDQMTAQSNVGGTPNLRLNLLNPSVPDSRNPRYYVGKDSGTAYAAANVAGYLAGLLQVNPSLTPADALTSATQYAVVNVLSADIQGYGTNSDLNGANNLILHAVFPNYKEDIITAVHNSTVTSVALGEFFDIVITNGSPNSYFTYTGSATGKGQLDSNGSAVIKDTFALVNPGNYVYRFYFPLTNHSVVLTFDVIPAIDVTSKNIIYAGDYDRIQNRVKYLIHDLYGNQPISSAVDTTDIVTTTSWSNLYKDIDSVYIHQNNSIISNLDPKNNSKLTAYELNSLSKVVDKLIDNFDKVDSNQLALVPNTLVISTSTDTIYDTYVRTLHWTTSSEYPNIARNFFNLGGYVEVNFENPILGTQTGYFTLTDYIRGSSSITLTVPGGEVISNLYVQGTNGNTATIETIVAPTPGNTALATGTVKIYASTDSSGGIASQIPTLSDDPLSQGQLVVYPVSQFITLTGNKVTTHDFTVHNTSPNDIIVYDVNVIDDVVAAPLSTKINTGLPFTVPARVGNIDGTTNLSVSFQNTTPGGISNLYNNAIQIISDGPNPVLDFAVPIVTKFGITVSTDPLNLVVTRATTATIIPTPYAGTITSYSGLLTSSATGFQLINPGSNYTYFTLDDTPGKLTMGLLLANELFAGRRIPSTSGAFKSPFSDPMLVVDVASIPNKTTSTQITYTAYSGGSIGTYTTTVNVTPNVVDKHLGSWLSPKNFPNGVIGFSYDIINGERCLTYGFGMGAGGSGQVYVMDQLLHRQSYGNYGPGLFSDYSLPQLSRKFQSAMTTSTIASAIGSWNTGTTTTASNWSTTTQILNYSVPQLVKFSTGTDYNPFLQTYGVWNGFDSTATTAVSSGTFLARDQGDYKIYLNIDARIKKDTTLNYTTATVTIDGIQVAITTTNTILSGTVPLTPGLHTIVVNGLLKPSRTDIAVITQGAVACVITDYTNYPVWSTIEPIPSVWAEIGRIHLVDDNNPHQYQIPTNIYSGNIAGNTSYSTYFKNNSMVTVNDNGVGQLTISLNPVVSASTDDLTNGTLTNVPYLFYYASAAENQTVGNKRYNNYQTVGQYVRYFTGFDRYGTVTTKNVLAPGFIAPPTVITQYYNNNGGGDNRSFLEKLFTFVGEALLVGVVVLFGVYCLAAAGVISVGAYYGSVLVADAAFSAAGFWEFVVAILPETCFTWNTKVTMADGSVKDIKDINAGEYVYNQDMTRINRVKYVEITVNKEMIGLYSPDKNIAPFATLNHPLYVNGNLSSLSPKEIYKAYPWLGMTSQVIPERSGPLHPGELMYNLYLDGDNTYIVNGYGTNSIIGDGGALRVAMEYGYLTQDRVQEMFNEYIDEGTEVAFGGYLFNKYFGKVLETIKLKFVVKLAANAFDQPKDSKFRQRMNKVFKFIGKQAIKRQQKALKK